MKKSHAFHLVLGGITSAAVLVALYLACILPRATLGITAVAGLFPYFVKTLTTTQNGLLCWLTSSFLSLLLLPQKIIPILFLLGFGFYPILKSILEQNKTKWKILLLKLLYANTTLILVFFLFKQLLFPFIPPFSHPDSLLFLGNLTFLAYDYGLSELCQSMAQRLKILLPNTSFNK